MFKLGPKQPLNPVKVVTLDDIFDVKGRTYPEKKPASKRLAGFFKGERRYLPAFGDQATLDALKILCQYVGSPGEDVVVTGQVIGISEPSLDTLHMTHDDRIRRMNDKVLYWVDVSTQTSRVKFYSERGRYQLGEEITIRGQVADNTPASFESPPQALHGRRPASRTTFGVPISHLSDVRQHAGWFEDALAKLRES